MSPIRVSKAEKIEEKKRIKTDKKSIQNFAEDVWQEEDKSRSLSS